MSPTLDHIRQWPDRVVLALCIYGEARNQSLEGQVAVACVARNRLIKARGAHPATSWTDILLAPWQFSCFNKADPNLPKILRVGMAVMTGEEPDELAQMLWIADGVMSGAANDVTRGADHYLSRQLLTTLPPSWAKDQPILATIGDHAFLAVA